MIACSVFHRTKYNQNIFLVSIYFQFIFSSFHGIIYFSSIYRNTFIYKTYLRLSLSPHALTPHQKSFFISHSLDAFPRHSPPPVPIALQPLLRLTRSPSCLQLSSPPPFLEPLFANHPPTRPCPPPPFFPFLPSL